jgi:hypothetical protein
MQQDDEQDEQQAYHEHGGGATERVAKQGPRGEDEEERGRGRFESAKVASACRQVGAHGKRTNCEAKRCGTHIFRPVWVSSVYMVSRPALRAGRPAPAEARDALGLEPLLAPRLATVPELRASLPLGRPPAPTVVCAPDLGG